MINRLKGTCRYDRLQDLKFIDPGVLNLMGIYYSCSGSLITNKHILTSAECLLNNREEMEEEGQNDYNRKMIPHYNKPECLFVSLGYMDKNKALDNSGIKTVKKRHIHDQAYSAIKEYNYNLGTLHTLPCQYEIDRNREHQRQNKPSTYSTSFSVFLI